MMHFWLVDHYDSFTLNIRDWLLTHPAVETVQIVAYDDRDQMQLVADDAAPIILGPGPKDPWSILPSHDLLLKTNPSRPVLGICLGHQLLGVISGANLARAKAPKHGVTVEINGDALLCAGRVAVYHSLVIEEPTEGFSVVARGPENEVMAIESTVPGKLVWGWQFHPESFMTDRREQLCSLWIDACQKHSVHKERPKPTYKVTTDPLPMPS
jgi:anthranilate/para-aminobenzoate synthase component II